MEKKTYYVVPQTKEILEAPVEHLPEYEIEANIEEVEEIRELLKAIYDNDFETYIDAHFWLIEESHNDNDRYDQAFFTLYNKLYELGTDETKQKIKSLGFIKEDS